MKSIGEAQRLIVERARATATIELALSEARGLVLAADVVAGADLPGFDHSAMDGYAARYAQLAARHAARAPLPVQSESRAGGGAPAALEPEHAMRIFTGAPIPPGADTVIIQEDVDASAAGLLVRELPRAGANIRRRGSDLAAGSVALERGRALGAGEIALLAALEQARVRVHRRPRVAIVCTGDELRALGEPSTAFTLVNSNGPMLRAQAEDAGADVVLVAQAGDRLEAIAEQLRQAIARADLVLTSGGVSVGDHDLVGKALPLAGVEALFWKVAMKPGKPLLFGVAGDRPVLGLPGNPVSAFVGFELFVRPALARMRGMRAPFPRLFSVQLAHAYEKSKGRPELLRARLVEQDGVLCAELHTRQGSGSLPSIAGVDALVFVPGEATQLAAGSSVSALRIGAHAEREEAPLP